MTPEAKELIIDIHARSPKEYKDKLEQAFSELFKPFKNGEWVKHLNGTLVRITDFENGEAYGFNYLGNWVEKEKFYTFKTNPEKWQKATESELIASFVKEFQIRGFKEGVKFKDPQCGTVKEFKGLDFEHFFNESEYSGQIIYSNKMYIYKDGVFAEIVEKKTIKPFENGEWIKKIGKDLLLRITDFENGSAYGFDYGNWTKESSGYSFIDHPELWQRTTEAEVIKSFKNEFKKRGFKEGVKFKSVFSGKIGKFYGLYFEYFFDENRIETYGQRIFSNGWPIYKDGVFAEIVEKKTIEQRLEAVEQFINEFKNKTK